MHEPKIKKINWVHFLYPYILNIIINISKIYTTFYGMHFLFCYLPFIYFCKFFVFFFFSEKTNIWKEQIIHVLLFYALHTLPRYKLFILIWTKHHKVSTSLIWTLRTSLEFFNILIFGGILGYILMFIGLVSVNFVLCL